MRRVASAWLLIILLLIGSGAIAYFSHDPTSPWLTRARSWPVVGRWAAEFQNVYRAPRSPKAPARDSVIVQVVPPRAEDLDAHPYAHLKPGDVVRRAPGKGAAVVARLDRFYVVPYFRRSGDWVEVRLGQRRGWVAVGPPERGGNPPLGDGALAPRPISGVAPNRELLAAAEACMSGAQRQARLGPYRLVTDGAQPGLVPVLDRLVEQVEPLYRKRYGLAPVGVPRATIVLFARKAEFETFIRPYPSLRGLDPRGTTMPGLVAVYSDGLNRTELEATLVHEITHLLNRRALGPALPSWIDEGMADDLASSRISPVGTIDGKALAGMLIVDGRHRTLMGAKAGVVNLAREMVAGKAPSLEKLATMDWRQFVAVPQAAEHYREAGLFFHYLSLGPPLPGHSRRPREGMVDFLRGIARGGSTTGAALLRSLRTTWGDLDAGYVAWLRSEIPPPFTLEDEISRAVPGTASTGE